MSSLLIDKHLRVDSPFDQGRIPSNRRVLTPVITATNTITTYSAMFATTPVACVLRRKSVIFSLLPAAFNLFSTAISLGYERRFNNGSLVGLVEHP